MCRGSASDLWPRHNSAGNWRIRCAGIIPLATALHACRETRSRPGAILFSPPSLNPVTRLQLAQLAHAHNLLELVKRRQPIHHAGRRLL